MSDIVYVDDDNFQKEVLESSKPVLVDFSATWCGPCIRQMPSLEKFASENVTSIKVCKLDIDDSPNVTSKLSIRSVPTMILFKDGVSLATTVGLLSLADISTFVQTKVG